MKVFKGFLKIALRNIHVMFVYLGIYLIITFMIQASVKNTGVDQFQAVSLPVAVMDHDGGTLAEGIRTFVKHNHKLVELEDKKEVLQEALFYRNVDYIITIPKGIETLLMEEEDALQSSKVPGSTKAYYVDQQINTFLNQVRVYHDSGNSMKDAVQSALKLTEEKANVTLLDKNGNGGVIPEYMYLFRFFPYIFIAVICFVTSLVMVVFREKDLKRRLQCAPISLRRQNWEQILAFLVLGVIFWILIHIIPAVIYQKEFLESPTLIYLLMNTFALMLVSLALSFFVGSIARNAQVIQSIVNVISLGMCFVGGVFVPYEMLGTSIRKVAQILPVYWYGKNNDILGSNITLTSQLQTEFFKGLGIQVLFAAACVCVALAVIKGNEQKKA